MELTSSECPCNSALIQPKEIQNSLFLKCKSTKGNERRIKKSKKD